MKGLDVSANVTLREHEFWIMMHGLPHSLMSMSMGETLGSAIGRVMQVDCDPNRGCGGEFLRIRVVIDIFLPFKRGLQVRLCEEG